MPYTARTWVSGEQITAAKLNTLENAVALYSGAVTASWEVTSSAAFTTTSGSFVDVTGVSVSVTTTGGDLLVYLMGGGFGTENSSGAAVAGVNVNGTDYTICHSRLTSGSSPAMATLSGFVKITGLAAGTYTVKARGKYTNAGVANCNFNNGAFSRTSLIVVELKR